MTYLAVGLIGVGVLCLVNLWLIIAMARVLRGHGEQLTGPRSGPRPVVGLPPGTRVPEFTVTTVAGATVSAEDLRGQRSVIAFFSPGCAPCQEQIPAFTAFARTLPDDAARPLAVICNGRGAAPGHEGGADHLARQLADVAHVVSEPWAGTVAATLAVSGFPSFILLDAGGRVAAGAHAVAGIAGGDRIAGSEHIAGIAGSA
jgi:thiol-disulfide isomerase/thioredoxin